MLWPTGPVRAGSIFQKIKLRPTQLRTVAQRRFEDAECLRKTGVNARANGAMYLGGPQSDPPEVQRLLVDIARRMPAWRKMELVCGMWDMCRDLAMAGLRRRHPEATEEELRRRLPATLLPPELVVKAYGWDPRVEGY